MVQLLQINRQTDKRTGKYGYGLMIDIGRRSCFGQEEFGGGEFPLFRSLQFERSVC